MNRYLSAVIQGLVQGVTEFLPVSSSGHLALLSALGVGDGSVAMTLLLHVATLFAVLIGMRKPLRALLKNPLGADMRFLLIATLPTAVMAGLIRYLLSDALTDYLPFFFLVTTALLFLPRLIGKTRLTVASDTKKALIVGITQGLACLNGISRSGSTTSVMQLLGYSREESANRSFLLSIPIIVGSAAVELMMNGKGQGIDLPVLLTAMAVAFFSGLLAIKTFLKIMKNGKLWMFGIYTFLLSIAAFIILF